jgi:hypothetical protein
MRLPLPRNRLVQLTLVGALLTTVVATGLLAPGVFAFTSDAAVDGTTDTALGPDAPTPNDQFTPATSGGDEYGEEGYEEEYEDEEHEDEEHEDYEDREAASGLQSSASAGVSR